MTCGDIVVIKRSIFTKHKHLGQTGMIVATPGEAALVGTIFVKWADGTISAEYSRWLERVQLNAS